MMTNRQQGFTLIEVLLALAIIAISLTALMKSTAQNVVNTQRIKEKTISHWVATQGVAMVQLGLLQVPLNQEVSQVTKMGGQSWYWRVKLTSTPVKSVQRITVTVSQQASGPFTNPFIAFKYQS